MVLCPQETEGWESNVRGRRSCVRLIPDVTPCGVLWLGLTMLGVKSTGELVLLLVDIDELDGGCDIYRWWWL